MINVTPVINLNGHCEEAMLLYEKAFGASIKFIFRYSDAQESDWNKPLTDEQKNMVYYAEMFIGSHRIMFSDIIEFDIMKGTTIFLVLTFEDADSVKKAYEILKEGCTIVFPMRSYSYSSCEVNFIDKFGIRWGLMTEQTEK
jgi:PhnB protein